MNKEVASLMSGLLMGAGLVLSGMTNPEKVLGFLDITGYWDPTLILVMGGSITFNLPASWYILQRNKPICTEQFHLPESTVPDSSLVLGSVLFGVGWGIAGICPGPALTSLLTGSGSITLFFLAMLTGFWLHKAVLLR